METYSNTSPEIRYLALDLHKHYVVIGGVNARQQMVLQPRRVEVSDLESWCRKNLLSSDEVVLEATTNAWVTYDLIAPLVQRCVVASPLHVRWIAEARVKTDAADVIRLAKLLAANLVPEVWVPPRTACTAFCMVTTSSHRLVTCSPPRTDPGGWHCRSRRRSNCVFVTTWILFSISWPNWPISKLKSSD
jgi:hypothetical protein